MCFPGGSTVKNPPANAGARGSIPGWGRSPGESNGNPLQYFYLGNPMDRGAWRANSPCSVAQSCPALCDPKDCSPPGASIHGILQARILEWVAITFSRGSSCPRDLTAVSYISCIGRQVLYHQHHLGSPMSMESQQSQTLPSDKKCYIYIYIYDANGSWQFDHHQRGG